MTSSDDQNRRDLEREPPHERSDDSEDGGDGAASGETSGEKNRQRAAEFHEATGSFRDVGIAIGILLILGAIILIVFVL